LRRNAPVSWVEVPDYRPFWAITRYADIMDIERENMLFTNWPRPVLATVEGDEMQTAAGVRTLIHMDDPQHRVVRAIGADWFRPKAMRALKMRVDELAKIYVDKMMAAGPECDFVQQVAVNYPLYVIMSLLGIPEADFSRMLKLTQELFGSSDSEFYYLIVATAGHDTTSSTISGGMHALIENPDQLALLRNDLDLMPRATEEMIRWVTPVKHFMRTAAEDTTVRGTPIAAGESVLLSYASANRDEDVFDDPFRFDVRREPNKHVAFGYGVHFCMGAALARMEVNSFFSELLPRLKSIELTGDPELVATTFVGGIKHLPVRY